MVLLLSAPNQVPLVLATVPEPSILIVALEAIVEVGPTTPPILPTPPCSTPNQLKVLAT
jgi:hypothetical protein